ncbi:MAG: hypothetical protein AAGC55_27480 [Myxococcota bacterium]
MAKLQLVLLADSPQTVAFDLQRDIAEHGHLSVAEAEAITDIADDVERNQRITDGYHRLKLGMAELIGSANLSWCAYASWSSFSVGAFIRGEGVPRAVRAFAAAIEKVIRSAGQACTRLLTGDSPDAGTPTSLIDRIVGQVAATIAQANRMVFSDIGPLFARMIATFRKATRFDQRAIDTFVAELRPGSLEDGGEDMLADAFRNYHSAMFETDSKRKAELILLANTQIGYHEQLRLQPAIAEALAAPLKLIDTAMAAAHNATPRLASLVQRAVEAARRAWLQLSTRWLMRLEMPDQSLRLGSDLPACNEDEMFPADLATIENPELRTMLAELDFTPDTIEGSAAANWADFGERMNYIVDLFRTRQQDQRLYAYPRAS